VNNRLKLPPSMKSDKFFHISQLRIQKQVDDSLPTAPFRNPTIFQKSKDGCVSTEPKRLIQHKNKAKGYLIEVEFLDSCREWIRASELKCTAPDLFHNYSSTHKLQSCSVFVTPSWGMSGPGPRRLRQSISRAGANTRRRGRSKPRIRCP
jgi:hypothetical protein